MTLKQIPIERTAEQNKSGKHFNPGHRIRPGSKEAQSNDARFLKNMCMRLVHFINRGSRFTYQQIDDLIVGMQRSILSLHKSKQAMLHKKNRRSKSK